MIIGITGPKRSGKTTLGNALANRYGLMHTSFAEPIRAFVAQLLGMSAHELDLFKASPVGWLDGVTPRSMMQTLGTEWGRAMVHPELWLRSLLRRIENHNGAVISDVRFPNEAAAILERGGIVLRLSRPGFGYTGEHASEAPLPDDLVSAEIENDGSPADLLDRSVSLIARPGVEPDILGDD